MKEKIKENKGWIIGSAILFVVGCVALLVGFYMTGWSIEKWLASPYAQTFFIVLILGIIAFIILMVVLKDIKDGHKYDQ